MSARRQSIVGQIERAGVVAVIRLADGGALRAVADALAAGGVRAIEVTMTVPRAAALINDLARTLPDDFIVGAGTVLDAATAREVIDAGARFVVSPVFRRPVLEACHEKDMPAMPG
jgi:2-dehydro-3-deoxyphosphogluconate aldolase/(4S)-4-hydroxy-2-oxoglutarate aldolase